MLLLLFTFCGYWQYSMQVLPSFIHPCDHKDPNIVKCILTTVDHIRPQLIHGIPELNVPPIDPLEIDEIKLRKGVTCDISNLKVWGPSQFEVEDLQVFPEKLRYEFKVRLPFLHFEGQYSLNTKILMMRLRGNGPIHGNLTAYEATAILQGNPIDIEGAKHIKFDKMEIDISVGHTNIELENLFQNDILTRATNSALNDNTEAILSQVIPAIEDSLAVKFTEIANKITMRFTIDELFL